MLSVRGRSGEGHFGGQGLTSMSLEHLDLGLGSYSLPARGA